MGVRTTYLRDDPGRWIYHYTKREAAFSSIVPSGRLRLSAYALLGDPLEAREWGLRYTDSERDPIGAPLEQVHAATTELKRVAKVLSLSVDAEGYPSILQEFGSGLARPHMWDQYAENHQGVCFAFDRLRLHELVLDQLGDRARYFGEVRYRQGGVAGEGEALFFDLAAVRQHGLQQAVSHHVERFHRELFFTKLLDWQGEHEYRYVVLTNAIEGHFYLDYGDALRAIFVGHRFPSWQEPVARSLADARELDLYRLIWVNGRPTRMTVD